MIRTKYRITLLTANFVAGAEVAQRPRPCRGMLTTAPVCDIRNVVSALPSSYYVSA
jgi:hypothetical protein